MNTSPTVTVIGAGLAGLSAALVLRDAGVAVEVIESRDRVGGRVRSAHLANGAVAEMGGEWIFDDARLFTGLCERFGLRLLPMGVDFARRDGRGSAGSRLAEQDELIRAARALAERLPPGEVDGWSLGRLLAETPGPSPARATVRARFQGTCAFDIDEIALRTALMDGMLREGGAGPSVRVEGGNDRLAFAMAAALPVVRLGVRVDSIEWDAAGVEVLAGSERARAHAAVVAVPAPVAAGLTFLPALPPPQDEALRELPMGVAAKLVVATAGPVEPLAVQSSDAPFWCWTALGEGGVPRSCLTSFAGSPRALARVRPGGEGGSAWLGALAGLVPEVILEGAPLVASWGEDPHALGAYSAWDAASIGRTERLREPAGRIAFAGEHTAPDGFHGTMEGALRSGRRAAGQVLGILESGP